MIKAASALRAMWRRFGRNDRGAVIVLMALALSVLIGFAGLGVETGLWYMIKRYNQSASDIGALSGAMEKAGGQPYSDICNLAKLAAQANGFTFASYTCPTSSGACTSPASGKMCVNNPPQLGSYTANSSAVEVILARKQNSLFAGLFVPSVTIDTRAVAGLKAFDTCMIALGTTGTDLTNSGNATLSLGDCSFISNSTDSKSITINGNVTITAGAIDTAGGDKISGSSNYISPPVTTGAAAAADPFAGKISYSLTGLTTQGCISVTGGSTTLLPGLYGGACAGGSTPPISLSGGSTVLCSGVYYLNGEDTSKGEALVISGSGTTVTMGAPGTKYGTVTCPGTPGVTPFGVTIIATATAASCSKSNCGGGFTIGGTGNNTPTVTLAAPSSSPVAGIPAEILFYQDAATADTKKSGSTLAGGSATSLNGVVYTPATQISLQGNASFGSCTELVAASYSISGTPSLSAPTCGIATASVSTLVLLE